MQLQDPSIRYALTRTIDGPLGNHKGGFVLAGRTRLMNVNTNIDSLRTTRIKACTTDVDDASRRFMAASFKPVEPKPAHDLSQKPEPKDVSNHQAALLAAFAAAVVTIRSASDAAKMGGRISDQDSLVIAGIISSMKESVTQAIGSMKTGINHNEKAATIMPSAISEMREKMTRMVDFCKDLLKPDSHKDADTDSDMPVERPSMQ